jgi:quercetin dioxygenase-like cupin family protein
MANPSICGDDAIRIGQLRIRYLRDGSGNQEMGTFELSVPPGSNVPPPHSHAGNDEFVYVLEGVLRYRVGAEERDLAPGDWMFTPRGTVHAFSNPHAAPARALVTNTPDIGAQYFRDVAAVVGAGGPPDKAKLLAVMQRHGLTPAS